MFHIDMRRRRKVRGGIKNIQKTKFFSEYVDGAFYLCYAIKAQETKALFFVLKIWEVDNRGFKAYQNHSCLYRVQTA